MARAFGKGRRPKSTGGYVDWASYSKANPRPQTKLPANPKPKEQEDKKDSNN